MAQDERTPGADVIDVDLAVGIGDARAFARGEETGCPTDAAEGTDGRVDAPRDMALSGGKEFFVTAGDDE